MPAARSPSSRWSAPPPRCCSCWCGRHGTLGRDVRDVGSGGDQPAAGDLAARLGDHRARHPGGVPRLPAHQRRPAGQMSACRAPTTPASASTSCRPCWRRRPALSGELVFKVAAAAGVRAGAGADLPLRPPLRRPRLGAGRRHLHDGVPDVLHRHALPGAPGDRVLLPRPAAARRHRAGPGRRRGRGAGADLRRWASCSPTTRRPTSCCMALVDSRCRPWPCSTPLRRRGPSPRPAPTLRHRWCFSTRPPVAFLVAATLAVGRADHPHRRPRLARSPGRRSRR